MANTTVRDNQKALIVKRTALKHGVTKRYVRMITSGDRENDDVMETYKEFEEALNLLWDNKLAPCTYQITSFKPKTAQF